MKKPKFTPSLSSIFNEETPVGFSSTGAKGSEYPETLQIEKERVCKHLFQFIEKGKDLFIYQHCTDCKRMLLVR